MKSMAGTLRESSVAGVARVAGPFGRAAIILAGLMIPFVSTANAGTDGKIVFAGDESLPPYEFLDQGTPRGASIDLIEAIGKALGRPVEVKLMKWAEAQEALKRGDVDALTLMSRSAVRLEVFDFSEATFPVTFSFFVRGDSALTLDAGNLRGVRVGLTKGGFPRRFLEENGSAATMVFVDSTKDGMVRLLRGEFEVFAGMTWTGNHTLMTNNFSSIQAVGEPFARKNAGIPVLKGDQALLKQINQALAQVKKNGTFDRIMNDWSGQKIVHLQRRQVQYLYALAALAVVTLISLVGFLYASRSKRIALIREEAQRRRLEKRLFQSQKMEAVGHLTGGMAHDFNNLLAVILGNVEILEDDLADIDSATSPLDRIRRSAERGSDLVQRLLSFACNQPLKPEFVDLNTLITDTTGILCQTMDESITIETRLEDSAPALVDTAQMENALLNLAINARDAMKDGGRLTMGTETIVAGEGDMGDIPEMEPGPYVIVTVSDTGIGMTEETLGHVFEPFYTNKGMAGHSGLGLSMVHGFIKQSGGHIHIDSQVGVGTSVKLYLPKATAPNLAEPVEAKTDQPEGNGQTILVVEDNPDVRDLTVRRLRDLGYEVLAADDGASGLAALKAAPRVNMLFTDVILPGGMSGPDMAKEAISRHPSIKVVYTSGYTAETLVDQGKLARGTALLCKPFLKQDLAQSIDQAFRL